MSMNLYVEAKRPIKFTVKGEEKETTETVYFELWQTPTQVTFDILAKENKLEAYIDWINSISETRQWPIYAKEDIFCEREPIKYETINHGTIHIEELLEWVDDCNTGGFTIEWYYL